MATTQAPPKHVAPSENITIDELIGTTHQFLNKLIDTKELLGGTVLVPRSMLGNMKIGVMTAPVSAAAVTPAKATVVPPPPKHTAPVAESGTVTAAPVAATQPVVAESGEKVKVAPSERNHSNDKSLRTVVFELLDRPEAGEGKKIAEIVTAIEVGKLWLSSSPDITQMVAGTVYKLKEDGKLARGENKKYYVPQGVTLEGPKAA